MSDAQVEEAAQLFRTLAEPARLRLTRALMNGPLTVTELVEATGIKQATVSKHLGVLYAARLLDRERTGNFMRYRIGDSCLHELCALVCDKLGRDAQARVKQLTAGDIPPQ